MENPDDVERSSLFILKNLTETLVISLLEFCPQNPSLSSSVNRENKRCFLFCFVFVITNLEKTNYPPPPPSCHESNMQPLMKWKVSAPVNKGLCLFEEWEWWFNMGVNGKMLTLSTSLYGQLRYCNSFSLPGWFHPHPRLIRVSAWCNNSLCLQPLTIPT